MNLNGAHYHQLEWIEGSGGAIGFHHTMNELLECGYILGQWSGSIEYEPYIRYSVTAEGRKALQEYKRQKLIVSTKKCENTCKAEYGCEVYKITPCINCGRDIVKG